MLTTSRRSKTLPLAGSFYKHPLHELRRRNTLDDGAGLQTCDYAQFSALPGGRPQSTGSNKRSVTSPEFEDIHYRQATATEPVGATERALRHTRTGSGSSEDIMPTFTIIGAGTGLGLAAARRFGREGFSVALISRTQHRVDELAATLGDEGIIARGYAADVRDPDALRHALDTAADQLGTITVLQYSPIPAKRYLKPVFDTDTDDLLDALQFSVLGLAAAIHQALPGMRHAGSGSILLVNGGSAARANPRVAGTSVAFPAESALGEMLHTELADDGVLVRQLIVPGAIEPNHPHKSPQALADQLWNLHVEPGAFRVFATPMDQHNLPVNDVAPERDPGAT